MTIWDAKQGGPQYRLYGAGRPRGTHAVLLEWAEGSKTVLDVGCASGYLAERLSGHGSVVDGLEFDQASGEEAKQYCSQVSIGSAAEASTWEPLTGPYDLVLFGDVLEHLIDPAHALAMASARLASGGRIIVSVPNVANIKVRWRLLCGHFDYRETGVMDRTHLRWFTRRTATTLFLGLGLRVLRWKGVAGGRTPRFLLWLRPTLFAPQFVFELTPG